MQIQQRVAVQSLANRTAHQHQEVPNPNAGEPYEPDTIVLLEREPAWANPGYSDGPYFDPESKTIKFPVVNAESSSEVTAHEKAHHDMERLRPNPTNMVINPHAGEPGEPDYLPAEQAPAQPPRFEGYC